MSRNRERERRRQRDLSRSSLLQEQVGSQVSRPERAEPASTTVSQLHDTFGNQFVLEALSRQAQAGPAAAAAQAIQLGIAGVDAQEQLPGSGSMSVLRAQLHRELRHPGAPTATDDLDRVIRRSGQPLPPAVQARMEAAFGHDFSHVRIHTDAAAARAAQDIQARAFAVGSQVYFGAGQFSPDTPQGQAVLAHELAHVEQADQGRLPVAPSEGLSISTPADKAEVEAVARARTVTSALAGLPADAAASADITSPEQAAPGGAAAPLMRDARGPLSGLSRRLSERGSGRGPSRRGEGAGRQRPSAQQQPGAAPARGEVQPEGGRGSAPPSTELLADAIATAIATILPPEEERDGAAEREGGRPQRGGAQQQARGDQPGGKPQQGGPGGQQQPGREGQRPEGGPEAELDPQERLERFVTGQIIEPAVAEVGLQPEHVRQALEALRPREQEQLRGRAQQRPERDPQTVLEVVPEALERAAPVLEQLRAEAGEGGVERPEASEVDRARHGSPEAEAATPPVVEPEPTPSTEPGPSAPSQSTTTPSAAAPVQPQQPTGQVTPADEAVQVDEEQDEVEELLDEAEQEAEAAQAQQPQQEREEAQAVPTGRGTPSASQQAYEQQRDYLEAEIHKVEIDLEWNETDIGTVGGRIEGKQDRIGDAQGRMDDNADRRDARRELVEERSQQAQAQDKPPMPPDQDGQLRFHELKAKRFPDEMKGYERDVNRLRDESEALNEEQTRLNELMQQLQDELAALQPPTGGGARGPENVPKICEKLSEAIERKKTETQRTVDTLTRETEDLQGRIETLDTTLLDLEVQYDNALRDWRDTQDDLDATDADLANQQSTLSTTDGSAAGQSVPTSAAGDNTCQSIQSDRDGLQALLDSLEAAWRTEIPTQRSTAEGQRTEAQTQHRTKSTELADAQREIELMDLAVTTLGGGTLLYEQIAARFGLSARKFFYPPGHRPWSPDDEFRTEEQMEAERQLFAAQQEEQREAQNTDNAVGPVSLDAATQADRDRDSRNSTDSDTTSGTQTAAQRREERERQEQQQRDALLRDISSARDMSPEERERRLAQLGASQSPSKTPAQLAAMLDQTYSDTGTAIASQNIRAPITQSAEEQQRMAEAAGVSVEALQRWSEEQVRRDNQARAARYLGMPAEQGQEAADRLASLGAERGLTGPQLLDHLIHLPAEQLANEPELAALKAQIDAEAARDPSLGSDRPDGMSVEVWREQQRQEAINRQATIQQTRAIAESMGVSFQEVDGYVSSLASASGVSAEQIRAQLQRGGPAQGQGQSMSPQAINARLAEIHLIQDPNQRARALSDLSGQIPTQQLMGAMLANGENGNGLVEGPVANQQLDARLDAIASMPMQQQWEAYANLSRMTGILPDELMRAQRNRDTRDQALNGVSQIRSNPDLSPQERTRRLEELAERMNLTTQQLNAAYEQSILATQAALARAAGVNVPQGAHQPGQPLTANLFEGVDEASLTPAARAIRDLQAGNLSGNDAERKIQQVAQLTGMDPADIRRFSAIATLEHNQREWGERLGMPGPDAERQLTTWAEQRGITPDQMLDHLRRLPPDQCPPEMREAQRNLMRWDQDNAGENQHAQDVDELARRRREAGLRDGETFQRIETDPSRIAAMPEPERSAAEREYQDYRRLRDEFINEMDETIVDDDDAIGILRRMTPAQRAALMNDPAAVDEDGYTPRQAFRNGVEDEELNEGLALMGQADKYNEAIASGVQERVEQATQDAVALEQRTQQTLEVATILGTTDEAGNTTAVPIAEANAQIDALARANGWSREETVHQLRTAPDPQTLLAPLYTVSETTATRPDGSQATRTEPSQALRQELNRINALPTEERQDALRRLQRISGLSDEQMRATQGEVTVQNHVVQTLHQARDLPTEERQRVLERLGEQTGRSSSELEAMYTWVMAQDHAALDAAPEAQAHLQRLRDCPIGDLQRNAEEVARQTGMPVDVVLRLAQDDRSRMPGRSVASFAGPDAAAQDGFRNEAYRRNMSTEEFADYLARSPAGELPAELQEMRRRLMATGYEVQRTESEQEARQRALGDPNDPNYIRQRNILFNQLTHDCSDEAILNALNAMTPAQRKMFFEEWEARRLAGGRIGGGDDSREMQPIEDQLRDALQGGDEDRGIALLRASQSFDPEGALELDIQDPTFVGHRDALLREIQPPGQPDPDVVRRHFERMTPAQRSQFLRDQDALLNAAAQEKRDGRRTDSEMPVRIDTLMRGDDGFQVMLQDAQRMNQDQNTARQRDAGRERAAEVETRVRETDRAIEALNWQGDRNQAYELLRSMAGDYQLSNENMLRMLEGRELVDDSDQTPDYIRSNLRSAPSQATRARQTDAQRAQQDAERSATQRESRGDTLAGYTLDPQRVESHATRIQSFLDGEWPRPTPQQVAELLQGCNPRELSELDRRLQPGGLAALTQSRRDANGRYLPRLIGPTAIEVNALQRRAEDYRTVEREDRLVLELSANDPRSRIDPSTPDGLAQRMAWARGLPPEQRVAELNRLQGQLRRDGPVDFGATIAQAYLGGTLGGSSQVMRPALLAQVQAAQNLPPSQRDAQLAMLARLSGHSEVRELEQAASRSQANLRALTEFQRIDDMPESERLAEINRLCQSTGMSEGELRLLLEQAENSGVLDRPLQELSPEAETELNRIKDITDPDERRLALEALGRDFGLTTADMIAHLNQQATEARQESQLRVTAERQAEEIAEKIRGGDEDEIRAIMQRYGNDPESFQRILREYPGGVEALQRALRAEFGRNDPDNVDFLDMIDRAEDYTPAPELPVGVDASVSLELQDILRRFPETSDPDQQRERDAALAEFKLMNGLSEASFASVQAHAEHQGQVFDQDVERRARMIEAEVNSMWVDDDRMRELIMGADPALLHALMERYPQLMRDALDGTGGDTYEDIDQQFAQTREVMGLPYQQRAERVQEMRVEYKAAQLQEEFDAWFWKDPGRVSELLADCSEEELRLLDQHFGGQLNQKIDEVMQPTIFQGLAVVAAFVIMGPLAGIVVTGMIYSSVTANETELQAVKGNVNASRTNEDGSFPVDQPRIDSAAAALREELDSSLWVSDSKLLEIMTSLNPRELAALQAQIEGDGPNAIQVFDENGQRMSFRQILEANMSGDSQAQAVALLADAEDVAAGRNRREELQASCRDLAIKERMDELARSPSNRGKSPEELYRMAMSDPAAIQAKTQERIKKIQDGANSLFKAIDGWGDNEKDVLKTLAGLTPEEIDLVKIEYRRHFGKDLETQMREDMGLGDWDPSQGFEPGGFWESSFTDHNEGKMALMMMSKEHRAEGVREFLLEYSDRAWCEDEDLIFQTLESMSVEERTKIVTMPGSEEFLYRIKRDLGTHEAQMVDALVAINPETGKAEANKAHVAAVKMKMAMHGSGDWWDFSSWGTDENDFLEQLDGLTPDEVQQAMAYYNANLSSGGSFMEEVAGDFSVGSPEWRVIEAEMRGDKVEADVFRLEYAAAGWGTDEKLIEKTLSAGREGRGGRSKDHLAQVRQGFGATFGGPEGKYADLGDTGRSALDVMLGQETEGMERVYFQQLAQKGKADDEITLLYAMQGAGTDEEKVNKVLDSLYEKSPEERAAFARKFRQMSIDLLGVDQTLEEWVDGDMSGTEGFEAKMKLMGKPQTPEEYLERARMRYDHERSGFFNQLVGNAFMDGLEALGAHSNGSLLIKQMGEIESMFGPDGKLKDPAKFDQLKELCEWEAQDAQRYRETRDKVADAVSNTIQVVGAVVVTVVTAGAGSGVLVAVIANLAVSLAATAVKAAMKGGGYGIEELGMDLANAAVSAAFAGVGAIRAAGQAGAQSLVAAIKAGKKLTEVIAKQGIKGIMKEALLDLAEGGAEGLLKGLINSEGALAQGDGAFLKHLLKETAMGGVRKVATTALGKGLGKTSLGKKLAEMDAATQGTGALLNKGNALSHLGLKYVDNVIKGGFGTVLDHNKWEQWAKGEGVDFNLIRSLFIDKAIESIIEVGARRTTTYQKYWANKRLTKAKQESEELWKAYEDAQLKYSPDEVEAAFGPKLEANQQAVMIGEQNLAQLNKQIAQENEQAIAQQQQRVQKVSNQIEAEDNRTHNQDPDADLGTADTMRDVARRMVEDAGDEADTLARGERPERHRRTTSDEREDTVLVTPVVQVGDEDSGPQPKRTITTDEAQDLEAKTSKPTKPKPAPIQGEDIGDSDERWAAFGNFDAVSQQKAGIIGAKAFTDDGDFSPALKAKLEKLGYTVRKNGVIARSDTGEQVPLHIEDGVISSGLKPQGKAGNPRQMANELLPGGSRGQLWKKATALVDQEIVLEDGRTAKVTRVVPTVLREGVDSEGGLITARRIAVELEGGEVVYKPLTDFDESAPGPRTVRPNAEPDVDPAPVIKALSDGDVQAITGGDAGSAAQVFAKPGVKRAVNQAFEEAPAAPEARQRQVKALLDSFGGDYEAAHEAFAGSEARAVRKALNAHRGQLASSMIREVQEAFPGLKVKAKRLDPNSPTLVFEFEGAETPHARAFLEDAARDLFGGSLKSTLGVELSEAPVRLRADAEVEAGGGRQVKGRFNDPISYEEGGSTKYFSDGKGGKYGYSTAFGFTGEIAEDGAFVVRQKVLLISDDLEDAGVQRVKDDVHAANATYFNDPKHRIVVDDVERPLRQELDVEIITKAQLAERQAAQAARAQEAADNGEAYDPGIEPTVVNINKGSGRADSSNLYTEGPESPATDQYRQMVIAHEFAHAIWGLADRYEDGPRRVKNPGYQPGVDHPDKEFIDIRSEARKSSGAMHVSHEGGLMEDFNVAYASGKVPLAAAKGWQELINSNWKGIKALYDDAGKPMPVKPGGMEYDWELALKQLNPQLADEHGNFPAIIPAGEEINLPKLDAPQGWGVSKGNLEQLAWHIGQAQTGDVEFELGDGSRADQIVTAEKAKQYARPDQRYSKAAVARAKSAGFVEQVDALSPSAIDTTRGRGKQRHAELADSKAASTAPLAGASAGKTIDDTQPMPKIAKPAAPVVEAETLSPQAPGRSRAAATPQVELGEVKGSQGREKVEGTKRYNSGVDEDGNPVRSTPRAARRGEDVTFNWPPGMPDADKQAFVNAVMGKLGLEVDNPDFDSFTGWSSSKNVVQARGRQIEDVLFEGSSSGPSRDLQGSTHRFTALMHIVESGDMGALRLGDVVGARGETVGQLYELWRRGEIGAQNAPDCFEPAKARAMVESIRKNGYVTDSAEAQARGLIDPANRGEIHGINILPADESGQTTSIDHKVHGWQDFVLGGNKPRSLAEWEAFRAQTMADEALARPAADDGVAVTPIVDVDSRDGASGVKITPIVPVGEPESHRSLYTLMSHDEADALVSGDADTARALFSTPTKRAAVDDAMGAAGADPAHRARLTEQIMAAFEGDFSKALASFDSPDSARVTEALIDHRTQQVRALVSKARAQYPDLDLTVLRPRSGDEGGTISLELRGPKGAQALAWLESEAQLQLGGSLSKVLNTRCDEVVTGQMFDKALEVHDHSNLRDKNGAITKWRSRSGAMSFDELPNPASKFGSQGYGSKWGFASRVDDDGVLEIRKAIQLIDVDGADLERVKADLRKAAEKVWSDPTRPITLDGMERQVRVVLDFIEDASQDMPAHTSKVKVHKGKGGITAGTFYDEGAKITHDDDARQLTLAHELGHMIFGLADTYQDRNKTRSKRATGPDAGESIEIVSEQRLHEQSDYTVADKQSVMNGPPKKWAWLPATAQAGDTWDSLGSEHQGSIRAWYNMNGEILPKLAAPVGGDQVDWSAAAKHAMGNDADAPAAGMNLRLLGMKDPGDVGAAPEHMDHIRWAIEASRKGEDTDWAMGDGSAPDQLTKAHRRRLQQEEAGLATPPLPPRLLAPGAPDASAPAAEDGLPAHLPTPKAPGWDDGLEITAPIPGVKPTRRAQADELEVTADLPGTSTRRGFHDDITADLPGPSQRGRITAEDLETFRENFNYDYYDKQLGRLLSDRPELQRLAQDHDLSHDELIAIYAYSRQDYNDMNMGLRGEEPEFLAQYAAQIRITNEALAKLPEARGTVFRRVKSGDWLDAYQEGATVTEKAYTSTSNDYDTMLGHAGAGSVEFVIKSRTGRDITQISGKGELENEVLFAPGSRFRVRSRTVEDDGTIVITMDEEREAPASMRPRAPGQESEAPDGLAPEAPRSGRGKIKGREPADGPLDLDFADFDELRSHGLSKKEANKILAFREQNGGLFDFELYAALHPDHEIRVVGAVARRSGREAEAVAAIKKPGENEAEAAQRVGIDPSDFGDRVQVHRVAELHNHFKGVLDHDDFPRLLFPEVEDQETAARQTIGLLRKLYQEDPGNELRLPHKAKATEAIEKILNSEQAESDPMWTLRRVMAASEEMPFDFTYDPRGLLIDQLKGEGQAEAFVRATAKRLASEGVTYAELQGKISTPGLSDEEFQRICAEEGVKIRMLPQLLTHQFAEGSEGFSDDKLMRLMFGDDYAHKGKVPDIVGGVDICGPESGRWSDRGMEELERAFGLVETEAQFSGRRLVFRPHVGEGYSGTGAQRRLGVEERSKQAATAAHNLELIVSRLEKMASEGSYEPPPGGFVQVRLGHVTATTPDLAARMARLGVIAEVNVGSNMITGAAQRAKHGDRLDQHPLPLLLYYGVRTVLSTDAQGVMSTDIPKEYGSAAEIIRRFRAGESHIEVPDPDTPGDRIRLRWGDLTPEQQERFDVGWLERTAQEEASAGRWDGTRRGVTSGYRIRRQRLSYTRSSTSRVTPANDNAQGAGPNRRPGPSGLRDELARNRENAPAMLRDLLERTPPDAPRATVVMNLIMSTGAAFEDLLAASASEPSMAEALSEFQDALVEWLEEELRKQHPGVVVRASGKGSASMQLMVDGSSQVKDQARQTLGEICAQTYGEDWERRLGVSIREPLGR